VNRHIKYFNESVTKEILNYKISYIKDSGSDDFYITLGSENFDNLIKTLKNSLSDTEFKSIYSVKVV